MEGKFAVLKHAKEKTLKKKTNIFNLLKKTDADCEVKDYNILEAEGFIVTLPIAKDDANEKQKDKIYREILEHLAEMGVNAIVAERGSLYVYDEIILALSGFYVLPFLLPLFLIKCSKILDNDNLELLIIDDNEHLTIDILCLVSHEINRITVLTDKLDLFEEVAEKFYSDSGLNIYITDKETEVETADVILNTSNKLNKLTNIYKKGAIYMDMTSNRKMTLDMALCRQDMIIADGMEMKAQDGYIDNVLLEAILYSTSDNFRSYLNGTYNNDDFYSIVTKVELLNLRFTTMKRFGANIM